MLCFFLQQMFYRNWNKNEKHNVHAKDKIRTAQNYEAKKTLLLDLGEKKKA